MDATADLYLLPMTRPSSTTQTVSWPAAAVQQCSTGSTAGTSVRLSGVAVNSHPNATMRSRPTIVTTIIYQKQRVICQQSKPGPYNSSLATARFTSTQQSTLAGSINILSSTHLTLPVSNGMSAIGNKDDFARCLSALLAISHIHMDGASGRSTQHSAHKMLWDHNRPVCPGPKGPTLKLLSTPATHNRSPEDVHHCQVACCAHPPVKSSNPPAAAAGPSSLVSYTIKP